MARARQGRASQAPSPSVLRREMTVAMGRRRARRRVRAGAAVLLGGVVALAATATAHEQDPRAWTNWEGTVTCHPREVATPTSVEEVAALVASHGRVRAAGLGHSFNDFVCSPDLMVSMRNLTRVLSIDPHRMTVTTQGGIKTRDLMVQLGDQGYALPTYPYYIDQSIAGAIATNSHGSSTRYGGLSSLVRAVRLVVANGSIVTIDESRPEYLAAVRANQGLLGVVVEVTLTVVKNTMAHRDTTVRDLATVLADVDRGLQDPMAINDLQYWYSPVLHTVVRTEVRPMELATQAASYLRDGGGAHNDDGTFDLPKVTNDVYFNAFAPNPISREAFMDFFGVFTNSPSITFNQRSSILSAFLFMAYPGIYPVSKAIPTQPIAMTEVLFHYYRNYNQYEFAVPWHLMRDCLQGFFESAGRNEAFQEANRIPVLIRFVKAEPDTLLSLTYDGPRLFINIDNYEAYKGKPEHFHELVEYLVSPRCQARLHTGKTSQRSAPGLDWKAEDVAYMKREFGDNWARFERIARELDPTGKFADPHALWRQPVATV